METIGELLTRARLSEAAAQTLLNVTPATWRRYRKHGLPGPARHLLEIYAGHMPWPAWSGWCMEWDHLVSPDQALRLSAADIRRQHFECRQPLKARYELQQARTQAACTAANVIPLVR